VLGERHVGVRPAAGLDRHEVAAGRHLALVVLRVLLRDVYPDQRAGDPGDGGPARRVEQDGAQGADGEDRPDHRDDAGHDTEPDQSADPGTGGRTDEGTLARMGLAGPVRANGLALRVLRDQPDLVVPVPGRLQVGDRPLGGVPGREHADLRRAHFFRRHGESSR